MTSASELRRENAQLREEKDLLERHLENRELKRQIKRLEAGQSPAALSRYQLLMLTIYGVCLISLGALCGVVIGEVAGDALQRLFQS